MIKTLTNLFKQDKEKFVVPKGVQDVIPVAAIFDDGIFKVGKDKYSKTYRFTDINYAVASREDKEAMFLEYSELLNSLDSGATTKITINNRRLNRLDFEQTILIPTTGDNLDEYREEYNKMLLDAMGGEVINISATSDNHINAMDMNKDYGDGANPVILKSEFIMSLCEQLIGGTNLGAKLKRNNYVVNRIKPDNEQIYYIIDAINDAINAGKQISFQYYDYTGLKKKVLKNKGEIYKLSPYKLLWCGDYYYVLGYSEKKSKVINFRVDRIASKPEILDKDIIPMPDDFDIENYTKEVFFMFSGEKVLVDLRCDNSLMKTMVDRFGEDVTTLAYDMTSFRVQTEVSASPTFFGWVFGFNGKVQILAPESVKEQYRQMIAQADEGMQQKENKEQEI